jgi:hypothetical protein
MSEQLVSDGQQEVALRRGCPTNITTAMLDFGLVVYGQCTSTMEYDDPRNESVCGAKLIAIWQQEGFGEDFQRASLGESYEAAKADLAQYRYLKALAALAEARVRRRSETDLADMRTAAVRIFASDLSDGAKIAALAMLLADANTAGEIARLTDRSLRTVERHYAEVRVRGYALYAAERTAETDNAANSNAAVPASAA